MLRKIIKIDQDLCNGCGACVSACHEGAIGMIDGKAVLLRDDYCDGLGDCLPSCPTNAISFETREALAYDEAAVEANMAKNKGGCPGSQTFVIHEACINQGPIKNKTAQPLTMTGDVKVESHLRQWPVQIQLAPIQAPYYQNANILIAADCSAYTYGNFHNDFMKNKVTLIGCPKLDPVDYSEKLAAIFASNEIKSVTVVRMEVPCCGGIENAVKKAIQESGLFVPWQIITISTNGKIIEE